MYYIKNRANQRLHEGSLENVEELKSKVIYVLWQDERCCGKISMSENQVQLEVGFRGTPIIFEREKFVEAYENNLEFFELLKLSPNLVWLEVWNNEGEILSYGSQENSSEVDFDFFSSPTLQLKGEEISYQYGCKY